ncbi:MAG: hypothetical protein V9G08_13550 [Dermatophilaceae bacterium]
MSRNILAFVCGAVTAAAAAIGLALAAPSRAEGVSIPRTGTLPVNRWVAEPGVCPLVFPGARPSEGDGWAIGPVEVTKGARFTAYIPGTCDDTTINVWARGAWQIAPDLVIYRVNPWDKTGSSVAPLEKEAIFGVQ